MSVRCVAMQGLRVIVSPKKRECKCKYRLAIVVICWCLFSVNGDFDVPLNTRRLECWWMLRILRLLPKSEGGQLDLENE